MSGDANGYLFQHTNQLCGNANGYLFLNRPIKRAEMPTVIYF